MDKNIIKETMLSLEGAAVQNARERYFDYIVGASFDQSEPIESDEQAQAEMPVTFPKPWTIPSTITPISWTS